MKTPPIPPNSEMFSMDGKAFFPFSGESVTKWFLYKCGRHRRRIVAAVAIEEWEIYTSALGDLDDIPPLDWLRKCDAAQAAWRMWRDNK